MVEWFALVVGAIGVALGTVALVQNRASSRSAAASATAAQTTAEAAERLAAAAQRSADAAQRAAEAAAETARMESERWHEHLRPECPVEVEADLEQDPELGAGYVSLFGSVSVPRDYRVYAEAVHDDARWPLDLPVLMQANRPYRFEIEKCPPGSEAVRARELRFLFWPPEDIDDVETWACPCARETVYGDLDSGHWEWRVPVAVRRSASAT